MAKQTPYWHPSYPTPDGVRYCEMDRRDVARLIRDHKRAGTLGMSKTAHGVRLYRLYTSQDKFYESGYIQMARTSAATS